MALQNGTVITKNPTTGTVTATGPGNGPTGTTTTAGAPVDPTITAITSANFDPTKGPVSSFGKDGSLLNPDGTVAVTAAQMYSGTVPDDILTQFANNPLVKEAAQVASAPLVGTAAAGMDILSGKYSNIPGDVIYGGTGGVAGNNNGPAQGQIITPDSVTNTATKLGDAAGNALGAVGTGIKNAAGQVVDALGNILGGVGSTNIDTSAADAETARANALADALGTQAQTAGGQADADRAAGAQTRDQQQQSIQDLQDAAAGKVPSAAELQLTRQSGIDAARQQGLAAALQGSNPSAALRQASMGAAKVAGDTAATAAGLRATEQANARNALATTLGNVRSADQGAVNTDVGQQGTLTNAQTASQGQGVTATGQKLTAEAAKAQADAIKQGALLSAAGTAGTALLSDKRAKKNIAKASLADALGKGVHGVTFSYTKESGEDDTPHFGLLAQELEKIIPGTVKKRGGMKVVDTGHLTTANTAILAELADRLMALEKKGARR